MIKSFEKPSRVKVKPPSFGTVQDFQAAIPNLEDNPYSSLSPEQLELNAQLFSSPVTPTEEEEAYAHAMPCVISSEESPPHPSTAAQVPLPESHPHIELDAPAGEKKDASGGAAHETELNYQEELSPVNNTFELKRDLAELSFDGREDSFEQKRSPPTKKSSDPNIRSPDLNDTADFENEVRMLASTGGSFGERNENGEKL